VLHYLADRYELDVLLFREPQAGDPARAIPAGLAARTHVIDLPLHARTLPARVRRNALRLLRGIPPLWDRFAGFEQGIARFVAGQAYDLAVIEHFWCARYLATLRPVTKRAVLNLHNIESALHRRYGRAEGGPARWAHERFAQAYERLEREWLPQFDLVLAASEDDARHAAGENAIVYPNAVPFRPLPQPDDRNPALIAFTGNMEYHPNVQAVRWFAREIWPRIQRARPDAEWILIGKNEHAVCPLVAGLAGVRCTGMVEDAVAELSRASVAAVPLLSGSGTRLKILEAWAAGVPVVSTPLGAEGLGEAGGLPLELASDPGEFSAAILRLLEDGDSRESLSRAARRRYEDSFTWEAAWKVLSGAGL
jgi:glycosyltransferase involved in cell wall biosynthesis